MPKQKDKKNKRDDDDSSENEEENVILDKKQYREFLNQLFPSSYMQNKIKEDDKDTPKKKTKHDKQKQSAKKSKSKKKGEMIDVVFTIFPTNKKKDGDDDVD